jgi:hypothetical protein
MTLLVFPRDTLEQALQCATGRFTLCNREVCSVQLGGLQCATVMLQYRDVYSVQLGGLQCATVRFTVCNGEVYSVQP